MKQVLTQDGSLTFYNEEYQEHYHTKSGAIEEALKKYVQPCRIEELAKKGGIIILDICFGLGYNSGVAIDAALKANPDCTVEIIGLENDPSLFEEIQTLEPKIKSYSLIKKLIDQDKEVRTVKKGNIKITILLGDARETIKTISAKVDAVFLDPFSPKRCPELWIAAFFQDIKNIMKKDATLATYSYARVVKDNLKKTGFAVMDGPCVGRRSPSTIARIQEE